MEEILLVMDPENMLLINDMNDRSGTFHNIPRFELGKCGLPYEVCSFNDLKKMDTTQYRFVILAHPFQLPPEKMTVLKEKLLNSNRTILWVYGTGLRHPIRISRNTRQGHGQLEIGIRLPYR